MERVSGQIGKEKATGWLNQLNEIRRLWAHPIRRRFVDVKPEDVDWIKSLREACKGAFRDSF
jgi:hypothetical protein